MDNYLQEDDKDELRRFRSEFDFPVIGGRGAIYLCGNSLGLRPKRTVEYVNEMMDDWAKLGVEGHTEARYPWMPYHEFLTKGMAEIAGCRPEEVVVMNSLTVNLHLLMTSFYRPKGKKYKILIEQDAFPSDQYAVASQVRMRGYQPGDAVIELPLSENKAYTETEDACAFIEDHKDEIALVMLGGVHYYSGFKFDFKRIVEVGHRHGCIIGFDMAHAAGNVHMNLRDSGADFACWCTYKYLNSGPGSLSGVFIHSRHHNLKAIPRCEGWWGHDKGSRFEMPNAFKPISTAEAWQLSNPPILPMACIRASLEIFQDAGMNLICQKSKALTEYLISELDLIESDNISLITPREVEKRGAQISIRVKNAKKNLFTRITQKGVIADWREPDVIRIAAAPLYNSFSDVHQFIDILKEEIR